MNDQHDFDKLVHHELENLEIRSPLADDFAHDIRDQAARTRRRPRWFARITEPPLRVGSTIAAGSPTARTAAIMAATMLLTLIVAAGAFAGHRLLAPTSATIIVDSTGAGTVTTLAEAVAIADDGDLILVRPGSYIESVTIEDDIVIVGDGPRADIVITAPPDGPTRRIGRTSQFDPYAILLVDSEAEISGVTLRGRPSAIHVSGGRPYLHDLTVEGVGQRQVLANEPGLAGAIVISDGSSARIERSSFVETGPIAIHGDAAPTVMGNDLVDGSAIMVLGAAPGTEIGRNTITDPTGSAIGIYAKGRAEVVGNTITGARFNGIVVGHHSTEGIDPLISGNTIRSSDVGIAVASAAAPTITGNTLSGNGTGLLTGFGSPGLVAEDNELAGNGTGIDAAGTTGRMAANRVVGGAIGLVVRDGASTQLTENIVTGASDVGLVIRTGAQPTLIGNRICDNATDVRLEGSLDVPLDPSNEICASTSVIVVDAAGDGTVTTLAEAVAMADDGDEIRVRPGRYIESVVVDDDLAIIGDGPPGTIVLEAPPDGPFSAPGPVPMMRYALLLSEGESTVAGLTMRGRETSVIVAGGEASLEGLRFEGVGEPPVAGADSRGFLNAIVVGGDAVATVRRSRLVESGSILIQRGAIARVEDNDLVDGASISALVTLDGSEVVGNRIVRPTSFGIEVHGGGHILIEDNVISDPGGKGVVLGDNGAVDTRPDIRRNTVERASVGIDIPPLSAPAVVGNILLENDIGLRSGWDSAALVRDNELRDNRIGIELDGADGRYEGNIVTGGSVGISVQRDGAPTLAGNDVEGTETAGLSVSSASLTDVRENRFCSLGESLVAPSLTLDPSNEICEP